jgi:hypothetical protein
MHVYFIVVSEVAPIGDIRLLLLLLLVVMMILVPVLVAAMTGRSAECQFQRKSAPETCSLSKQTPVEEENDVASEQTVGRCHARGAGSIRDVTRSTENCRRKATEADVYSELHRQLSLHELVQ